MDERRELARLGFEASCNKRFADQSRGCQERWVLAADAISAALRRQPSVEEVARVIDPLVYELIDALNDAVGEPEQLRRDATAQRDARLANALAKARQIAQLYSGKGEG
jgi:hypothetical protein